MIDPAVTFALVLNGGALIWGASKMNSAIETLDRTVKRLEESLDRMDDVVAKHDTRITVLEDRGIR